MSQSTYSAPATHPALAHGLVICSHLAILILLYGQTSSFDFVYFDDYEYVLANSIVSSGLTLDGAQWAFTTFYMSNWHPLTWLSHMLDVSLFGVDPGWAHLHNAALHGANSLLVYVLLLKLSDSWWKAGALSLIFLVHPLHVESVAWIAERKDLLCAFFFLLGLLLYDNYRAQPGRLEYTSVLMAYILALMAKPMAVTFPVVLLILDYFVYREHFKKDHQTSPGKKIEYGRAIKEKFPLFALSALSSVVTIAAQDAGKSILHLEIHSISSRLATAANAYLIYLRQFLIPVDLVAFYPIPDALPLSAVIFPGFILLVLLFIATILAPTFPLITAGLCWYVITLVPVIGLIQVGSQAHADRYMYLPSIGILLACISILPSEGKRYFRLGNVLSLVFIAYLTVISYWQISYWENRNTLFSRVLEVLGPTYKAHIYLAEDYKQRGMLKLAQQHSLAAVNIRAGWYDDFMKKGNAALKKRDFQEAEKLYRFALYNGAATPQLLNSFGIALAEQGHTKEAIEAFKEALRIEPKMSEPQENLERYESEQVRESN